MRRIATDAYAHVGEPRFGSVRQLLRSMDVHGIERSVAVLGPRVPDLGAIAEAAAHPGRLRTVGIPFGDTPERRSEAVRAQLDLGAIGIRFEYGEAFACERALAEVGRRGRWAYAIDACRDQEIASLYLTWLKNYPDARIAAPHFMYAKFDASDPARTGGAVAELMGHPRFYGIFVRNLGMCGSADPHAEYRDWIAFALAGCGPERLLWGSEYPVLFWRNERIDAALGLFRELLSDVDDEAYAFVAHGNADRLFFADPPPSPIPVEPPEWIERTFMRERPVPLFPKGWELSKGDYGLLLEAYLSSPEFESGRSMSEFLLERAAGPRR